MYDPQAQFLFSFFFFLVLILLHIHLWIFIFACTTTLRDFSILQAITTFILPSDISLCIFHKITVQSTRQEISFYSFFFFIFVYHYPFSQSHLMCKLYPPPHPPTPPSTHIHPRDTTQQFISQFKRQFRAVRSSECS